MYSTHSWLDGVTIGDKPTNITQHSNRVAPPCCPKKTEDQEAPEHMDWSFSAEEVVGVSRISGDGGQHENGNGT